MCVCVWGGGGGAGVRLKGGDIPKNVFYPAKQSPHNFHVHVFDAMFGICSFNSTIYIGNIFLSVVCLSTDSWSIDSLQDRLLLIIPAFHTIQTLNIRHIER